MSDWKIVRRGSELFGYDVKVWVIQLRKYPNVFKYASLGERAEFTNHKDAEDYLKFSEKGD
jgi:hypothetical protein